MAQLAGLRSYIPLTIGWTGVPRYDPSRRYWFNRFMQDGLVELRFDAYTGALQTCVVLSAEPNPVAITHAASFERRPGLPRVDLLGGPTGLGEYDRFNEDVCPVTVMREATTIIVAFVSYGETMTIAYELAAGRCRFGVTTDGMLGYIAVDEEPQSQEGH